MLGAASRSAPRSRSWGSSGEPLGAEDRTIGPCKASFSPLCFRPSPGPLLLPRSPFAPWNWGEVWLLGTVPRAPAFIRGASLGLLEHPRRARWWFWFVGAGRRTPVAKGICGGGRGAPTCWDVLGTFPERGVRPLLARLPAWVPSPSQAHAPSAQVLLPQQPTHICTLQFRCHPCDPGFPSPQPSLAGCCTTSP